MVSLSSRRVRSNPTATTRWWEIILTATRPRWSPITDRAGSFCNRASAVVSRPMTNGGRKKKAIAFVCHAGELEIKALLLAGSLRRFLDRQTHELICAVPRGAEPPSSLALRLLEE